MFLKTKYFCLATAIFAAKLTLLQPTLSFAEEMSIENETKNDLVIPSTIDGVDVNILNVNSGGKAIGTLVNYIGTMNVNEQGVAEETSVSDGGVVNLFLGGTATNTTVTGNGTLNVSSGQAETVNASGSSTVNVDGGILIDATIDGQGKLNITNGGAAQKISIGSEASISNSGNSYVDELKLNNGAKFDLTTDASITNITDEADQTINASINNKVASGFSVNTGSTLTATNGGSIENSNAIGGTIIIDGGSTAQHVAVSSGGNLQIYANGSAKNVDITDGTGSIDGGAIQSANIQNGGTINATNNALIQLSTVLEGGVLNIASGSSAENIEVNNGGIMNVEIDSNASNTFLNDGGQLNVKTGATINSVTVNGGGIINAETASAIYNLVANSGSVINVGDSSVLFENFTIHVDTNATASNFDNLFQEGSNITSLTIVGGVNEAFNKKLINNDTTSNKALNLSNGNFVVSNSGDSDTVLIGGWNEVNVIDSVLRLEADLMLSGNEKNLSVDIGSTLDVSGTLNNISNITVNGNIINKGSIDMSGTSQVVGDTLTIEGAYSGNNASIIMDMDISQSIADKIIINGDVLGKSTITLKSVDDKSTSNKILLVQAPNNVNGNIDSFSIWRSEASPFVWETLFENNSWYGYVSNAGRPLIVPETAAYYGLIDNTFMQTASLGANLRNSIAINEYNKVPCRLSKGQKYSNRICRSARPVFTGWITPVYSSATIEAPYNYTTSISGVDGGIDIISNGVTKFGLLASYRNGIYNYDESGENYTLRGEAETIIDSYLGGAYIRTDGRYWSVLLAGYAGLLDANISTKDGVEADTSGTTYGATLDVNYIYKNISGLRIEPGVRLSYTSVKMDEVSDNAGKTQEFEDASRTEFEAGIKIAKRWEFPEARAEIFVKPSVVQIMNDCGEFELIEDMSLESAEDRTLMKVEAGMSFDMIENWSALIAGSYSFGSDYTNSSANLSLIYNF